MSTLRHMRCVTSYCAQLSKPTSKTHPSDPYDKCDVYSLSCVTCNKEYIGQTSHRLNLCYKEHITYLNYKNPQSAYALHILKNPHQCGPIEKTMTLLKPIQNTSLLSPYKHFYIQSLHKAGNLISEQNPNEPNPLIQLAINHSHPPFWPCQSNNNFHTVHTAYVPAPHDHNQVCTFLNLFPSPRLK
jgi:hypothetical protein